MLFHIKTCPVSASEEVCTIKLILVVEDNIENLELVVSLLERKNYKLMTAMDGEKALELVNKHCFDLIILDILLPKIDGIEVLKRLTNTQNSNTPVIAVTACYMKDEEMAFLLEKCTSYLSKPYNIHQFYETVSFHLAGSSSIKTNIINLSTQ
jgi:CheY-like chemotaxis protein